MSQVLSETDRTKIDSSNDESFYRSPRFVTHADDPFCSRLTDLYASVMSPGDRIFDAMSSWVSFLPPLSFERVVGHGLNRAELEANEQFDEFFVQDFNVNQRLPLDDEQFDVVCCALSVQYLQYPGAIFMVVFCIAAAHHTGGCEWRGDPRARLNAPLGRSCRRSRSPALLFDSVLQSGLGLIRSHEVAVHRDSYDQILLPGCREAGFILGDSALTAVE